MFKKSAKHSAPELFNSFNQQLSGAKRKVIEDCTAWHNIFQEHITSQINEDLFSVLFSEGMGRGNASIRVLIAMSILKEGHGWSDEQLFEHGRFNMLVMNALGFTNFSDEIPAESTYYFFRRRLYEYQIETGTDLLGECFKELTKHQAELFGVSGKQIRMDSKLMGSNIATCSRLQLVIRCLQVFYKSLSPSGKEKMPESHLELVESLMKQSAGQIVFRLDATAKSEYLKKLGAILLDIQTLYSEEDSVRYKLITRVFEEQFNVEAEEVTIKENKDISAKSLQSPFDEDATYRKKGDQKIQGYSVNMTETCNEEGLNLVTDTVVKEATAADCDYLEDAIEATEGVVGEVDESHQDGAYHSPENDRYAEENGKTLYHTGFPGKPGRFSFKKKDKKLFVTDTKTNKTYEADNYKPGRYKIKIEGEKYPCKYFTDEAIESFFRREEISNLPQEILNKRPNVEAAMFQVSFFTRNNKTRYRGKFKTQMWATNRSLWMNLRRIKNHIGKQVGGVCPDTKNPTDLVPDTPLNPKNWINLAKNFFPSPIFIMSVRFKFS